jgi:hypothetical protein
MTKELFEKIERMLFTYRLIKLNCDGNVVVFRLLRIDTKLLIAVMINGRCDFDLAEIDCEVRDKFYRPRKLYRWPMKYRAYLKKFSKKKLAKDGINPNEHKYRYSPVWRSFNSLKRHLVKKCSTIEIL